MSDQQNELPAIHTWWPYLTITARHAVLIRPAHPLAPEVIEEIERITGATVAPGSVLSDADVQYVAAQTEFID
ncbi:hypothetical protein LK09_14200 [Microbacterium mangrovi]|uniref:Uncharacterized protein n=1 Tax=Microbacterium mangrovi TaxID=1348253 RepID=A0A0B1ZZ51_9MICO|nr:hypothetical protein [Microbacterium mangrovi]KHK96515.1 hypothetical protein LK09_14200 [Microbacterium mangrovi]